jgi:hypothetical protein
MRIQASIGRAPKKASLKEQVYKLTLTAETPYEKKELAKLSRAIWNGTGCEILFTNGIMNIHI